MNGPGASIVLAIAVVFWLVGFDIIYSLQDYEFDRTHGLHSLAVRWEPKNALMAAFAAHPSLKMATVVDDDIDPTDPVAVEYAITTRCQADRDFMIMPNAKGSSLDPSSDQANLLTTKVGIDATASLLKAKERFEIAKIPGEEKTKLSDYL